MISLHMNKKEWKKYKFIIERGSDVQKELLVPAALDEHHAWHLGLAIAMREDRDLIDSSGITARVEEIA